MKTPFISLITALALSLLAVLGAAAQGPVTITVTQIDQSRFPQIDVFVSATDANGNPVRNLSPDAFRLEQNGQPVSLLSATRSGEQGPVSTVLVVDHSGSMAFSGKIDYFIHTVFNYPTLAECYKTAAFDGINRLG